MRFLLAVCFLTGCAALGGVSDGSSVAYGPMTQGALRNGVRLPAHGEGYQIPDHWAERGSAFGTDELVAMIVHVARRVGMELPGSTLYVADLSPRGGGGSRWHRTHQTGRDVDLHFFALDDEGKPAPPPANMPQFGADGVTTPRAWQRLVFDTARNWALVRAILEDPDVDVQFIFVADALKQRLLRYAAERGESAELIAHAEGTLHQPEDSRPHDDHFHVRIYCPASDGILGCQVQGKGSQRWPKNAASRRIATALAHWAAPMRVLAARPFCQFLSRSLLAAR